MSGVSRRQLLRLIGAAGASSGLGIIATACGGRSGAGATRAGAGGENLRGRLRALIDELEQRYPIATALAITGRRIAVGHDVTERGVTITPVRRVVLQIFDGVSWYAQEADDLSADAIVATADKLSARAPRGRGGERQTRNARTRDFSRRGGIDLATGASGWQAELAKLFATAQKAGSSRVVYRGSYFHAEDVETLFIGDGQDLRQTATRARAGSVFVARDGRETIHEEASRSGTGLEVVRLREAALEDAARRVLTVPAGPPTESADTDVVLRPQIAAAVVRVGLAARLNARSWQRGESLLADFAGDQIGDAKFTLRDDPTRAGAYASYDFDDEGWLASPRSLVHRGVLRGPLTDRFSAAQLGISRTGHSRLGSPDGPSGGRPAPHHSNLIVESGRASLGDLIADVRDGFVIDGPVLARCDPGRGRVLVRARRAREVVGGSLSGRVLGPIALRSSVESLLLAIRAVGSDAETAVTSSAPAATITAPTILTRAEVGE